MRLPFSRPPEDAPAAGADAVQAARTRARRRLVGALVLLVIGVLVFPLLFETDPRPVAVDTAIVTASREPSPAPRETAPAARMVPPVKPGPPPEAGAEAPPPAASAVTPPAVEAAASAVRSTAPPPAITAPARTAAPASEPAATSPTRVATAPRVDEAARARALLEAKMPSPVPAAPTPSPAAQPEGGRFIVQVGAYSDAATLREARARVERLGLKTYTQVIDSDGGPRTRVRVGPFATREEATAAANKLKSAGLPGNVLAL